MNTPLTNAVVRTLRNTHGAVRTDKSAHVFNQAQDGESHLPAKCYLSSDIRQSYCLQRKFKKKVHCPGIEPGSQEWESCMIPLHQQCCTTHTVITEPLPYCLQIGKPVTHATYTNFKDHLKKTSYLWSSDENSSIRVCSAESLES